MSSTAQKTLTALLAGEERLPRSRCVQLLRYLGFDWRYSNSTHITYSHPACAARFTWTRRKAGEKVWGYQLKQLRDAVKTVLKYAPKEWVKKQTPQPAPVLPIEKPQPATRKTVAIIKENKSMQKLAKTVNLRKGAIPPEVVDLVLALRRKEIRGPEFTRLLNDSGYRTATGSLFTAKNYYSCLVASVLLQEAPQATKANEPIVEPTPSNGNGSRDSEPSIEALIAHLKRLQVVEAENKRLRSIINRMADLVDELKGTE